MVKQAPAMVGSVDYSQDQLNHKPSLLTAWSFEASLGKRSETLFSNTTCEACIWTRGDSLFSSHFPPPWWKELSSETMPLTWALLEPQELLGAVSYNVHHVVRASKRCNMALAVKDLVTWRHIMFTKLRSSKGKPRDSWKNYYLSLGNCPHHRC